MKKWVEKLGRRAKKCEKTLKDAQGTGRKWECNDVIGENNEKEHRNVKENKDG